MRTSNCNINKPGAIAAGYTDRPGPREWIPLVLVDAGPGRCQLQLPDAPYPQGPIGLNIEVALEGCRTFLGRVTLPAYGQAGEGIDIELEQTTLPFPDRAVPRAPLPPPPQPVDYDHDLWFPPPSVDGKAVATKRYWRGNFGCVTIPGLPWVPGMASRNYDRLLTGFLGRYPPQWQDIAVNTYAERPYTHFLRWVQDERNGAGVSIPDYVDQCHRIHDAGIPYVAHSFLSKTYAPFDDSAEYCRQQFGDLIDALLKAECLDLYSVGFELNLFNSPESVQACIDYFAVERNLTEATDHPGYVHFSSEVTWWGRGNRSLWWDLQRGKLTGLLYQSDPAWGIRLAQEHYRDSTDVAAGFPGRDSGFGHDFDFVALETQLERAFGDNADLDENDLDQMGYYSLCTRGRIPVMGFGNGCRRPSGDYV